MIFKAAHGSVFNRGEAPLSFLIELVEWAKNAPDQLFTVNDHRDVYSKTSPELGPYENLQHRKAVMLEILRVLALFESGCNWNEGVDSSRRGPNTNENKEAGPWQQSYNCRRLNPAIPTILSNANINDGVDFQNAMKKNHSLSMTVTALVLRGEMKDFNKIANGPLRKGSERKATWTDRPSLWDARQSIYPHLSREAVAEFQQALAA